MRTIAQVEAYYPMFPIGGEPQAVPCTLRLVQWEDGKTYLKTPFALLTAHDTDDHTRAIDGQTYFKTSEECLAMMQARYPNWKEAAPIADALCTATQNRGKFMGECDIERRTGFNTLTGELHQAARGHKSIKLSAIRKAVKQLAK